MRKQTFLRKCWNQFAGGRTPAFVLGSIFTAGLAISLTTYAVHDIDVFELDNGTAGADAIDNTSVLGADWAEDNFPVVPGSACGDLHSCGYVAGPDVDPMNPGGGAFRSVFIQDPNGSSGDGIFAGGSSKDDLDISGWLWKSGATSSDKTDLLPVGAAAFMNGDLLIYTFGTLFAPNGDAAIGTWLLKKNIGLSGNGSPPGSPFCVGDEVVDPNTNVKTFVCDANQPPNMHSIGDVLVVSENTNGGRNVGMAVYQWVDENNANGVDTLAATAAKTACVNAGHTVVNNTLCLIAEDDNARCSGSLEDDSFCGNMNLGEIKGQNAQPGVPTESPDDWGYLAKPNERPAAGPASPAGTDGIGSDDFPPTTFFEAGFNFSNLFPGEVGCFNTFLMNTRASQSVDSVLEDLAIGKFPLCGISVDKIGPEKSKVGDDVTYTYTITNTGAITLYRKSIVDDVIGNLTATSGATCEELAPQASCTFTVDYTVQEGDADPLVNTVDVVYNSAEDGSGDDQTDSDDHTVNLFQPSITFDKTGDDLSKIGDEVKYTLTLNNTSSADSPDLECTITDALLGIDTDVTLASGQSHEIKDHVFVIPDEAADPFVNTAYVTCSPKGFPNVLNAEDSHSTNLFQPSIALDKTGDTLSKVGDPVTYTITLTNNSSDDSPDMVCTITDTMLDIDEDVTLGSGEEHEITADYTVQESDTDPLPNTASVTCSPDGFPNVYETSDGHEVNLFQPSVIVDKSGDTLSKVGDDVDYTITVTNTSSADSPNLVNGTIVDDVLGDLLDAANPYVTGSNCTTTLATAGSCTITATRTVLAEDPDPLPNTVEVHYNPSGFTNDIWDSDDHSVNLFQPSVIVDKSADCEVDVIVGQTITYTYVVTNTSSDDSPNLVNASIEDDKLGNLLDPANTYVTSNTCTGTLATANPDASCTITAEYVTQTAELLTNTVDVEYNPSGFQNEIKDSDDATCNVVLPAPAFVVIEKELLDAENLAFNYSATGLPDASYQLIPLFGQLPLAQPGDLFTSPFPAVGAGDSFDTTDPEIVNFETFGQSKPVSVTEGALPDQTEFVSLTCQSVVGDAVIGVASMTASLTLESGDVVFCRYVNQFTPSAEGCTPGFWKNHPEYWAATGYKTTDLLGGVGGVFDFGGNFSGLADDSMMDALNYPGGNGPTGAAQILLRAAVAAVLNASHPDVEYSMTEGQVIDAVSDALQDGRRSVMLALATQLDNANNGVTFDNFGTESCPLGGPLPQ